MKIQRRWKETTERKQGKWWKIHNKMITKRCHWSSDVKEEIKGRGVINVVVNETSQHSNTFDVSYQNRAPIWMKKFFVSELLMSHSNNYDYSNHQCSRSILKQREWPRKPTRFQIQKSAISLYARNYKYFDWKNSGNQSVTRKSI